MSTMTGPRWCARLLSLAYYFLIVPFLYDLFMHGAGWRSAYLFPFILLGVSGIQIGYKENDGWVRVWFWVNLAYAASLTCLAFFYPPFSGWVALTPTDQWILFAFMAISILALPLNLLLPKGAMKPVEEEEDLERGLPPTPNKTPAK